MITWYPAPLKTVWGSCMRHATIELDKDSVLDLYCDQEDIPKVINALNKLINKGNECNNKVSVVS